MSDDKLEYRKISDGIHVLVDRDGNECQELTAWLEPREIRELVSEPDVTIVLDLCEDVVWDAELTNEVMSHIVTAVESHKLSRVKYSDHVIYAPSLWCRNGGRVLVLSEESAKSKKVIRELRGDYKLENVTPEGWFRD